jgi:hypothetical protein
MPSLKPPQHHTSYEDPQTPPERDLTSLGSIPTVMKAAGSKPINFQNDFKGI